MTTPIQECMACHGKGYIFYNDDDSCDVQPCECTIPVEGKR